MKYLLSFFAISSMLLVIGCDSTQEEDNDTVNITISGRVLSESSGEPLDSTRAYLIPPTGVGEYIVDLDTTDSEGRYDLQVQTSALSNGFCLEAGAIIFLREQYVSRAAVFVPPGYENQAGDDTESLQYISFRCDANPKTIEIELFIEEDTVSTNNAVSDLETLRRQILTP